MRKDQEQYIRHVRATLAAAIQRTVTSMTPFLEADERGRAWSGVDRLDADEHIASLATVTAASHVVLSDMPRQASMGRVDKERFKRALRGLEAGTGIAHQMTIENLVKVDNKKPGAGQKWFLGLYKELMLVLRHALAAMFYLVNDARLRTIKLSQADTDDYRYGSAGAQAGIEANFEAKARDLAHRTGSFVEVVAADGEVLFDASPHPATVRKELAVVARKEKKQWPYVANRAVRDYDVLASLYEWEFLE